MAIGDNFDTTPPGFRNRATGRVSGHGRIYQRDVASATSYNTDDNKKHPCNVGCGCKTACHEGTIFDPEARCQLPPELTIYVTRAGNRGGAKSQIAHGNYTTKVHLVYSKGAWRGRKCCEFDSNGNELCDPCDVTTDQFGNKTDCSHGGQEGATRNRLVTHTHQTWRATGPPGGTRRNNPDSPRQADLDRASCLQDGDIPKPLQFCASYTDADFNNLYSQIGSDKCSGGFCIDGGGNVNDDNEKTCCDNGFTWKYQRCLSGGSPVGGSCVSDDDSGLALDGSTCDSKSECDCKFYAEGCGWTQLNEFECLAKFKSDGYTWSHNWISDTSGNPQDCCSQELISDRSPAHQPNISAGEGRFNKAQSQLNCLTPYEEYILRPGGVPGGLGMGCLGVDNPSPDIRRELGEFSGPRGVFTLIIRGCDYNKNCLDSEGAQDGSSIGKETILYIPIDQMINCSDFRLPHDINTGALGNPAGWFPDNVNACNNPDEGLDGIADANGSGCSVWIYDKKDGSGAPTSARRVHPPGEYNLRKLNIKAQPFKATESKQRTVKTLKQAQADMGAHKGCICYNGGDHPVQCPRAFGDGPTCGMDIDHGLAFWFENDYIGGPAGGGLCEAARDAIGSMIPYHWEDAWTCRDGCGRMTDKIHYKNSGISSLIWQSALVGDSGLYTGRLDYWGDTGLAPFSMSIPYQPETSFPPISHVIDNCYGTHRGGRSGIVEFASNTSPIVIKSTNHGLRDMDFISVKGVMGNFSANVMTLAEWKAVGWQEKIGEVCKGETCPEEFNPTAYCYTEPFDSRGSGGVYPPQKIAVVGN